MRGVFDSPEIDANNFRLTGKIPASTSIKYPIKLASMSEGKAKIATKLMAYEACSDDQGKTTEYRGVSPLDTLDRDKWIYYKPERHWFRLNSSSNNYIEPIGDPGGIMINLVAIGIVPSFMKCAIFRLA